MTSNMYFPSLSFRVPVPAAQTGMIFLASLFLLGCANTPYERPMLDLPARWEQAESTAMAMGDGSLWWQRFNDLKLDRLVQEALARNNDLASAVLSVREAQLNAGLAGDPFEIGPQASFNASNTRRLDQGTTTRSHSSSMQFEVSYTVDLWGRLARQRDIKQWALEASEADRENVRIELIGTTANLYWQLAYVNQRLDAGEKNLATALRTRQLVQAQYAAGASSALELSEAEQTVLSQRNSLSQMHQTRVEIRNSLALLFNAAPGSNILQQVMGDEPQALPLGPLPPVDENLPAALLARRPDLRSAELSLRQSLANVDVVRTGYYPALTLTGAAGTSSESLGRLLADPVATLGAGLNLPFLNIKEMQLNTKIAQVQYEEAAVGFRQTLYQAFADVENALSARTRLAEQIDWLERNLTASREAERLYEIRYRAGGTTLRTWLDAQDSRRSAELSLAEGRLSQLQNQITLYEAMGGDSVIPRAD